jgi:hypothetical protein
MTRKHKEPSPLVAAAIAFDEALEAHARTAELFVRAPLASTKHIERVNELLGEITGAEEKLREHGAALAAAVTAARDRQEALAQQIIARLPEIKERNDQLHALLARFQVLGAEGNALNQSAAGTTPRELAAALTALGDRAEALAVDARTAGFDELASQGHALHQRLAAAAKKLHGATL